MAITLESFEENNTYYLYHDYGHNQGGYDVLRLVTKTFHQWVNDKTGCDCDECKQGYYTLDFEYTSRDAGHKRSMTRGESRKTELNLHGNPAQVFKWVFEKEADCMALGVSYFQLRQQALAQEIQDLDSLVDRWKQHVSEQDGILVNNPSE